MTVIIFPISITVRFQTYDAVVYPFYLDAEQLFCLTGMIISSVLNRIRSLVNSIDHSVCKFCCLCALFMLRPFMLLNDNEVKH